MVRAALIVSTLGMLLAGCASERNPEVCGVLPPRVLEMPTNRTEQIATAHSCVANWAVRLSLGDDSAADVATAALGACEEAISAIGGFAESAAVDEKDTAEDMGVYYRLAMFHAVQQRSGHCGLPGS